MKKIVKKLGSICLGLLALLLVVNYGNMQSLAQTEESSFEL
ncbi:MAG: hypothetical protein WBM32_20720 [Crocosphaera sp.]